MLQYRFKRCNCADACICTPPKCQRPMKMPSKQSKMFTHAPFPLRRFVPKAAERRLSMTLLVFDFANVLYECLLVDEAGILAIPQNADKAKSKLHETLVYKVHRGVEIQSDRSLAVQTLVHYKRKDRFSLTGSMYGVKSLGS